VIHDDSSTPSRVGQIAGQIHLLIESLFRTEKVEEFIPRGSDEPLFIPVHTVCWLYVEDKMMRKKALKTNGFV
jgi:hypothetical protein